MIKFLHHLLNPHCPHCLREREIEREHARMRRYEEKQEEQTEHICESCETLTRQLEIANHEKAELLNRLLDITKPPQPEIRHETVTKPENLRPKNLPWGVRRQMLEQEDRATARALKDAAKPDQSVEQLEKELAVGDTNV